MRSSAGVPPSDLHSTSSPTSSIVASKTRALRSEIRAGASEPSASDRASPRVHAPAGLCRTALQAAAKLLEGPRPRRTSSWARLAVGPQRALPNIGPARCDTGLTVHGLRQEPAVQQAAHGRRTTTQALEICRVQQIIVLRSV